MGNYLNTEKFIEIAKVTHNNKFDYNRSEFVNQHQPIIIICPDHGEYLQAPRDHLRSTYGCPKCVKKVRSSSTIAKQFDKFKDKADKKFGDKFKYIQSSFVNTNTPISIICDKGHSFKRDPDVHLVSTTGCPVCYKELQSKIREEKKIAIKNKPKYVRATKPLSYFIERVESKFGKHIFDFSQTIYHNQISPVTVRCIKHDFYFTKKRASKLLESKGCPKCSAEQKAIASRLTEEQFIEKSKNQFGTKYDYSNLNYIKTRADIKIRCIEHDHWFTTSGKNHIDSDLGGCKYCIGEMISRNSVSNTEKFVEQATLIHDTRYGYALVDYKTAKDNVKIICHKHGVFNQMPATHLNGGGCIFCTTWGGSIEFKFLSIIKEAFPDEEIITQAKPLWLGRQRFDIYFPDYNIAIELQGRQHFRVVGHWGGKDGLESVQKLDEKKYNLALDNDCKLYYFTYVKSKFLPETYLDKLHVDPTELINEIKSNILAQKNL